MRRLKFEDRQVFPTVDGKISAPWLKRSARLLGLNWPSSSARRLSHLARGRHETTMTVRKTRAGERIRTADHPLTRRALCLLSYTGVIWSGWPDMESLPGYRFRAAVGNELWAS
jgi:hypothetical protein